MVFAPNKVRLGSLGQGFAKWEKMFHLTFLRTGVDIKRALRKKRNVTDIYFIDNKD